MKQARMVRPRPSASVAALAPLERRGGCGTCHGVTLFRPNIALDLPGFGTSESNGLARNDVVKQAREFPSPGHQREKEGFIPKYVYLTLSTTSLPNRRRPRLMVIACLA